MAEQPVCRLALVLATDISASVDAHEDALQRGGLAAALIAPEIRNAFLSPGLPVALAVYEWSGRHSPAMILDWRMIRHEADLLAAAETVAGSTRSRSDLPTAIGEALGFGNTVLRSGPECQLRTLDVSGDGISNHGYPPASAYRAFDFEGITVNGLVINAGDFEGEVSLVDYYRDEVLHGPGAFLEVAQGFEDFERAMRRKLLRELSGPQLSALPTAPSRYSESGRSSIAPPASARR